MKKRLILYLILVSLLASCSAPLSASNGCSTPEEADLVILADTASKQYLGASACEDGLLKQFKKESGYTIYVSYVGGTDAENMKNDVLSKTADKVTKTDIDAFIFDSSLFAAGLKDQKFIANTYVGPWIRKDVAEKIGWTPGSKHTLAEYASIMETGQLKMVAPNALQSIPGALSFFATLGSFYGPENTLTYEQVVNPDAINYGKKIYDNYSRSTGSTDQAIDLVFQDAIKGSNSFDGVIAYESSFVGTNGLNAQLEKAGKQPFIFFYFSDASIKATLTMGRIDNLSSKEKEIYKAWSEFVDKESSQKYIASQGVRPGGFGYEADAAIMNPSWGLEVNPNTTLISSPVYVVANKALYAYRDYYKRAKNVGMCEDVSPSMTTSKVSENMTRLSALNEANIKITNPKWLETNRLTPGPKDIISYYFFSGATSGIVTQSIGNDTEPAGKRLSYFIGNKVKTEKKDEAEKEDNKTNNQRLKDELGLIRSSTAIFDCADARLKEIIENYSPDVDYYIVLLTDGENVNGLSPEGFYRHWQQFGKQNVTVIGISFGADGSSVDTSYTSKFHGLTYSGTTDKELVDAFKKVFGN